GSDSVLDQFTQEGPVAARLVHTRAGAEQRDRLTLSHPRSQFLDASAPRFDLGEIARPVLLPGDGRTRLPVRRRVQRAARPEIGVPFVPRLVGLPHPAPPVTAHQQAQAVTAYPEIVPA